VCHDRSFSDRSKRVKFTELNPKVQVLAGQDAEAIYEETFARWGIPDAIVSNDAYPITRNEIEYIPIEDLRATFEAVVVFPIRLVQQFIPGMKQRRSGSFVFITSAREARPEPRLCRTDDRARCDHSFCQSPRKGGGAVRHPSERRRAKLPL
jgi:3-oxoacyl-[acyl-carrier protein] reductase